MNVLRILLLKKQRMKILIKIFIIAFVLLSPCLIVVAQDNMSIIPDGWMGDSEVIDAVNHVSQGWKVIENYKDEAWRLTLWQQFSSWIMNWDTILDYCAYLAKFLWQVALLVWAFIIIYMWYEKIVKSFIPEQITKLWRIVLWLVMVIFAYAIIKLLWSAFIS